MLPAQVTNVCEASLRQPPKTSIFLAGLKAAMEAPKVSTADVVLFGDTFSDPLPIPPGTEKNQKGAYNAITNFEKVMMTEGAVIEDLDDYMVAFAKWTLSFDSLCDSEEQKVVRKARRNALCQAANVPMHEWSPDTLTTYTNALCALYKASKPEFGVVMRAKSQFPKYVAFLDSASSRLKKKKARTPMTKVLGDGDIVHLFGKTDWGNWFENQRMNILIFGYGLGQRRESMQELCVGNFHVQEGGKQILVRFGKMKNLQGGSSKDMHEQLLVPHAQPKLCPIAAYFRQMKLLAATNQDDPFFVSRHNGSSKAVPTTAAKEATFKGTINWARKELGRPITFKDCARRPVFTRLLGKMGAHDAAKAVGVVPQTMDRYYAGDPQGVLVKAAEVFWPRYSFFFHCCPLNDLTLVNCGVQSGAQSRTHSGENGGSSTTGGHNFSHTFV